MLTAADLNKIFDDYADKLLVPTGFKKSGIHYYKKVDGQYYAIIKDTSRGYFMDYYLTYSHEAAGKQFELLQKKPSVMLKDYPVSIAANDLKIVYKNYDRLIDSHFYFYSLSRGFKIDKHCEENEKDWNKYFSEIIQRNDKLTSDRNYLDEYVKNIFEIITHEGFKFFDECDLNLCYKSVLRPIEENKMSQYRQFYQTYLDNFNAYFKANNIEPPSFNSVTKRKWFGNLFKLK
ncbi:MAG TPA: hypothetical protein VHZ50_14310 [Puia sp.]|jgi:hypothetical protein|nr:hypothetical protein [Puia sp.]